MAEAPNNLPNPESRPRQDITVTAWDWYGALRLASEQGGLLPVALDGIGLDSNQAQAVIEEMQARDYLSKAPDEHGGFAIVNPTKQAPEQKHGFSAGLRKVGRLAVDQSVLQTKQFAHENAVSRHVLAPRRKRAAAEEAARTRETNVAVFRTEVEWQRGRRWNLTIDPGLLPKPLTGRPVDLSGRPINQMALAIAEQHQREAERKLRSNRPSSGRREANDTGVDEDEAITKEIKRSVRQWRIDNHLERGAKQDDVMFEETKEEARQTVARRMKSGEQGKS